MRLHHVGIVVRNVEEATAWWCRALGFAAVEPPVLDEIQKVKIQLLRHSSGCDVELIEPASPASPVSGFLERGGGVYHVCFEVNRFDGAVEELRRCGAFPAGRPARAIAFGDRRIAFLVAPGNILIELVESRASADPRSGEDIPQ